MSKTNDAWQSNYVEAIRLGWSADYATFLANRASRRVHAADEQEGFPAAAEVIERGKRVLDGMAQMVKQGDK